MKISTVCSGIVAVFSAILLMAAMPTAEVLTHDGDTTIINTTTLGASVKGFKGATPVKIYIKKNKIIKIVTLKNSETPKIFNRAQTLLEQYEGKTTSKAIKLKVDGVSGATYSSNALKKNVELGLAYYKQHK